MHNCYLNGYMYCALYSSVGIRMCSLIQHHALYNCWHLKFKKTPCQVMILHRKFLWIEEVFKSELMLKQRFIGSNLCIELISYNHKLHTHVKKILGPSPINLFNFFIVFKEPLIQFYVFKDFFLTVYSPKQAWMLRRTSTAGSYLVGKT